jgi:hypothetical protein
MTDYELLITEYRRLAPIARRHSDRARRLAANARFALMHRSGTDFPTARDALARLAELLKEVI